MSSLLSSFQQYLPAAALILLPGVGSCLFTLPALEEPNGPWYKNLKKPSFNPPNWIVGPVWTVVYACLGVSSYLVYREGGFAAQSVPLALFGSQMVLNWIWHPIFFYAHRVDLALINNLVLCTVMGATLYSFRSASHTAAYLMLLPLGWVAFATFLTFLYWKHNGNGSNLSIKES